MPTRGFLVSEVTPPAQHWGTANTFFLYFFPFQSWQKLWFRVFFLRFCSFGAGWNNEIKSHFPCFKIFSTKNLVLLTRFFSPETAPNCISLRSQPTHPPWGGGHAGVKWIYDPRLAPGRVPLKAVLASTTQGLIPSEGSGVTNQHLSSPSNHLPECTPLRGWRPSPPSRVHPVVWSVRPS